MKNFYKHLLSLAVTCAVASQASYVMADPFTEALTGGKVYGDFRLRYETVDQDNAAKDADALTLRTRLGYVTGSVSGFSATAEFEDSRVVGGIDDYTVGPTGFNPGEFSVIADPETTELDQGFVQYESGLVAAKLGRQVITLDNHRFVGHVGWRQDRQTFDAFTLKITPVEDLSLTYGYLGQRNRIFAEVADIDSKDHLFNASYKTPVGKVTGYAYLLEVDNNTDNSLDSYGISLNGATNSGSVKVLYTAEYATQEFESGATKRDADYYLLEGGIVFSGITAKLGYEVLGSDDGLYGFATPLATLHKFNGWSDQFLGTPAQGLEDIYVSVGGKIADGKWGKWAFVYHDFSANESTPGVDNLGSEIDLLYAMKFAKHYSTGIKYANYSADDIKVDADKLWIWLGASF
ncbi:MAG: alginate export family protein [Candidatus Thiodiazotropha sp. (ex Dulcina madagascariensis)]|nr:alginate export family protein [Candidatus Thiodiazotropha sp. (ex Dulcina madagascariensis)]MCU7927091.1 alginate export family protein [Candidatus Thiodiazotropha sp. (ex Dulcina madagascariensis)]